MATDTREDYSEFYPGGGSGSGGGGGSTPVATDKVDRFTVADPGLDPSFDELKNAVRSLIQGVAPVATAIAVMVGSAAFGQTARLGVLKSSSPVVTNETDAVAIAQIAAATNATLAAAAANVTAATNAAAAEVAAAYETKSDAAAKLAAANAETAAATNALAARIPTVDLTPYAQKSWVEAKGYVTDSALTGLASQQWVQNQEYVTKAVTNGLAGTGWVQSYVGGQGYVTKSVTNGLVGTGWVQSYVGGQGYVTKSVTNGLASQQWVQNQPYVTKSVTNGLAGTGWVQSYVNGQGFVTKSVTNGIEDAAVRRAQTGMATTKYVDDSIQGAVIAAGGSSNTAYRLMRGNGSGYIDGWGNVYSISNYLGWSCWTNGVEWAGDNGYSMGWPQWNNGTWTLVQSNTDVPEGHPAKVGIWSCAGASNLVELTMNFSERQGDYDGYEGVVKAYDSVAMTNYVTRVAYTNEITGGGGGGGAVASVNGKTGVVVLDAGDVGARASDWEPSTLQHSTESIYWNGGRWKASNYNDPKALAFTDEIPALPTAWSWVMGLTGFPTWITANKPTYTAAEVGARADDWMPSAADVGALAVTGGTITNATLSSPSVLRIGNNGIEKLEEDKGGDGYVGELHIGGNGESGMYYPGDGGTGKIYIGGFGYGGGNGEVYIGANNEYGGSGKLVVGGYGGYYDGQGEIIVRGNDQNAATVTIGDLNNGGTLTVAGTNVMSAISSKMDYFNTNDLLSVAMSATTSIVSTNRMYELAAAADNNKVVYSDQSGASAAYSFILPSAVDGKVSDWVVYLYTGTTAKSVNFSNFNGKQLWMADAAYTNEVLGKADTPMVTGFYFTQLATDKYMLSRIELKEVRNAE